MTLTVLAPQTFLEQEARALLARVARMKPFALYESMVPAAAPSVAAQAAIERCVAEERHKLRGRVNEFLAWLRSPTGAAASPADAQRRFTILRMRFNVVLSQFDLFADVLTQRSEFETGVWLAGLDAAATDALALPRVFQAPPVLCYLDRGPGAAIRRARTRIPGGKPNPVAIVRVPRERMIGSGIASSLVHEVGHQGAALLGLVESLRGAVQEVQRSAGAARPAWLLWERWVSEIAADLWSVARLGITSTLGLMAVVTLPRAFVTRVNLDDPHPTPWLRVKLSCAIGDALYPHPQWSRFATLWESLYPVGDLDPPRRQLFATMQATMPAFVSLLIGHRPSALQGASLAEALSSPSRTPGRLAGEHAAWRADARRIGEAQPSLAFAVLGQARIEGRITPEEESQALASLLTYWALRGATDSYWAVYGAPAKTPTAGTDVTSSAVAMLGSVRPVRPRRRPRPRPRVDSPGRGTQMQREFAVAGV